MPVSVRVNLGALAPEEVVVEFYAGEIGADGAVKNGEATLMRLFSSDNGFHEYACTAICQRPGAFGYSARIRPADVSLRDTMPGYVVWAK